MKRITLLMALALLTGALSLSCERLSQPAVETEILSDLTDIPADYGELEAVTAVPEYPHWFQLWFEDAEGTIRMVRIRTVDNKIHGQVEVITRSGMTGEEVTEDEG